VDAGQQLHRPQLQKREPQRFDAGALTVGPSREGLGAKALTDRAEGAAASEEAPSAAVQDDAWLRDRIANEAEPDNAIRLPPSTRHWDSALQQYRDDLEEAAKELRASKKGSREG